MMDKVAPLKKPILILGDFNIDLLKSHLAWESTIHLFGLKQLVKEPTRITPTSATLIDHIYCTTPLNVTNVQTLHNAMSDHCPVACVWSCKTPSKGKGKHTYVQYRSTKNFNSNTFLLDLSRETFDDVYQCSNPEDALNLWYSKFNLLLDKHAPLKKRRVKHQTLPKWLTPEIINTMKERDACKKDKRFDDYKKLRNKVSILVKEAKKKYIDEIINNGNDTASLWRAMNTVTNKSQTKANNNTSHSPQDFNQYYVNVADTLLNTQYKNQLNYVVPPELELFCETNRRGDSLTIPPMAVHEVGAYINKLKNKRSMGPDNISIYFLKLSLPYIVECLTFIFNMCIQQCSFPSKLKEAKVIPIPKTKNPANLQDFRPISLLPVLSKPLEKHIHKHLTDFIEDHSLFYKYQSGFRKHHSCQTALTAMCDEWKEAVNKTLVTGAVFLDLKKAFDLIDHNILIKKFDCYFRSLNVSSFVKSYLENRNQCVHINGQSSEMVTIRSGVPQGSILGPLFFCLFINDLPLILNDNVNCDMFADDNSLHSSDKTINQVQNSLQQGLNEVEDWCLKNRVIINPEKTKSMVVTTRQKHQRQKLKLNLTIQSTVIEQVREHKVLGIILDEEMKWQSHINHINKILSRNLFLLSQLKPYVDTDARLTFFYAHCLSHINYASNVWCGASANHIKHLNSLHRRAAKLILSDPSLTTEEKQQELGILPLDKQFLYNTAILMQKVRLNKTPTYLNDLVTPSSDRYGSDKYILPLPRVDLYKTSFSFSGPSIWNSLPPHATRCSNMNSFKIQIRKYFLETANN
jgi:hypothetical protein